MTKTRRQLRAEAVERLRGIGVADTWLTALLGVDPRGQEWEYMKTGEIADRLADLLADDDDDPGGRMVLEAIDDLRRELSGYHGQLKAHDDLQAHCDRQREQLAALMAAHKQAKDERGAYRRKEALFVKESADLRDLVDELYPLACRGAVGASELDVAHGLMRGLGIEVGE